VGAVAPCAAIGLGDYVARATGTVAPTGRYAATPTAGPQSPAPQRPALAGANNYSPLHPQTQQAGRTQFAPAHPLISRFRFNNVGDRKMARTRHARPYMSVRGYPRRGE